jgi:diaminopimelate epimerase
MVRFAKAHAYGNDFLYVEASVVDGLPLGAVARALCDRHTGVGADGLILYERTAAGATMTLLNADGGRAEVSGNGLRGLGALLLARDERAGVAITIHTEAGDKRLVRLGRDAGRQTFRTTMGRPANLRKQSISAGGESLDAVLVDMGNPQCIVLGPQPDEARFQLLGAALEKHTMFPQGTNVEFATVESPQRVRIRIWERGCGPTMSSGTGSCASLVAAAAFGGAQRDAEVIAPGGIQRVEWLDDGVYLTGWAELICEGEWSRPLPPD